MTLSPRTPEVGFLHRKLAEGDLYFVANTSNVTRHVRAQFRDVARHAEVWDAFTGEVAGLADPKDIALDLAPYESRLVFFSDAARTGAPQLERRESVAVDLSRQWKIAFGQSTMSTDMDQLASWTEDAKTRFYSGLATYRKSFELPQRDLQPGTELLLDFGAGKPETLPSPPGENNMKAYLEAPVREAAQVYVNEKLAGVVWRPPYRLDVTQYLHAGANELRIVVGNTAINELAGQPLPDYRLLWDRYGKLFEPQGMQNLHPLPSGILGPVVLMESRPVQ
jgi:hypothetical protein